MGQKKLIRFAELETFSNVLQYPVAMASTCSVPLLSMEANNA